MSTTTATFWNGTPDERIRRAGSGVLAASALMSSPEVRLAREWEASVGMLRSLGKLTDDWDGLGAGAPQPELVDSAESFLETFRRRHPRLVPTRIAATPDGSIVFEWQAGRMVLEAIIEAPDVIDLMLEEPNQPTLRWQENLENNNQDGSWGTRLRMSRTG
jgi:hypothetical protein